MPTERPMTYEEFYRRRIREILEDRPITPNPFVTGVRIEDGRLVFEVTLPADAAGAAEAETVEAAAGAADAAPPADVPPPAEAGDARGTGEEGRLP